MFTILFRTSTILQPFFFFDPIPDDPCACPKSGHAFLTSLDSALQNLDQPLLDSKCSFGKCRYLAPDFLHHWHPVDYCLWSVSSRFSYKWPLGPFSKCSLITAFVHLTTRFEIAVSFHSEGHHHGTRFERHHWHVDSLSHLHSRCLVPDSAQATTSTEHGRREKLVV